MDVFHLQSKESVVDTSLTFVVDVTGSMGSDIDAVITSLATIVTDSRSLEFIPSKYVLVTFSDPGVTIRRKSITIYYMFCLFAFVSIHVQCVYVKVMK